MTNTMRKTIVYGAVLAALVLIFILQLTVSRSRNTLALPEVGDSVTEISIATPEGALTLQGGPDTWTVGEAAYPADSEAINDLLQSLRDLKEVDVISNRGQYADYGLEEGTARTVRITRDGENDVILHLGNMAAAGNALYARINAGSEVVLLPRSINGQISIDPTDYRNTLMAEISEDSIRSVRVDVSGFDTLTLRRREFTADEEINDETPLWEAVGLDGAVATATDVDPAGDINPAGDSATGEPLVSAGAYGNFFEELGNLRAQDFIENRPAEEPFATLTVSRIDGPEVEISLWPPDDISLLTVEVSDNPYLFVIPEWRARRLLLSVDKYFEAFETE